MKRLIASVLICFSVVVVATADEMMGTVIKFEDGKITLIPGSAAFAKKGEVTKNITLPLASDAKFFSAKILLDGSFKVAVEGEYEGGKDAFANALKEASERKGVDGKSFTGSLAVLAGVNVQIVTEGDKAKVIEIRVINGPNFFKKGGS